MAKIIKIKQIKKVSDEPIVKSAPNLKELKNDLESILTIIEQNLTSCQGS